jgi:hypothetical protein
MLKRVALFGAIAALTIWNPSHSVAQAWDGAGWDGAGSGGGDGWGRGCCGAITVTVGFPRPRPFCCRPFIPRPAFCCRPVPPRPVWCCNRPYSNYGRPLYYYGDRFAPYGYNWNSGYGNSGYANSGYTEAGYGYDE